jgi:hypothetical protein
VGYTIYQFTKYDHGNYVDKKQIEKELRKEELKSAFIKPAIVIAMIATGLFILFIATPKPPENQTELIMGKTIRDTPVSSGYGYDSAMIVKLEDGKEARVPMNKNTTFINNSNVEIKKITSPGGTVTYEFVQYQN